MKSNKLVAMVILGFGTVTSFVFICIAMIKIMGNKLLNNLAYYLNSSVLNYFNLKDEKKEAEIEKVKQSMLILSNFGKNIFFP